MAPRNKTHKRQLSPQIFSRLPMLSAEYKIRIEPHQGESDLH